MTAKMMSALACEEFNENPCLIERAMPVPAPGPGEVRLQVASAGIGFVDALICAGQYQVRPPLPFVPGSEVAGWVDAVGPGVESVKVGDRVAALVGGGGLGDHVIAREPLVARIPDALSFTVAAGCITNYCTLAFGLQGLGQPVAGETMLVLGAGGGLGMAGLDFGRMLGLRTVALASTAEKRRSAREQGADIVIEYEGGGELRRDVEAVLGKNAVDIVFDPVGGPASEAAFRLLAIGGRHLVLGFASGEIPRLPLNLPLLRRASVVGVDWGGAIRADATMFRPAFGPIVEALANGSLRPADFQAVPRHQAQAALTQLRQRKAHGKLVLERAQEPTA